MLRRYGSQRPLATTELRAYDFAKRTELRDYDAAAKITHASVICVRVIITIKKSKVTAQVIHFNIKTGEFI